MEYTFFCGLLRKYTLRKLLKSSLNIYFFFKKKLKKNSKLILYNGRHNESRPIVRYCNKKSIPVDVMEFSGDGEKNVGVRRFKNHLPTDLKKMEKNIKFFWKNESPQSNKCDYYFKYKRAGRVINDRVSYILKQKKKMLPEGWDNKNKNVVYFTSSQDEYSCLGGVYDQTIYKNQNDSIFKIVKEFKKNKNKKNKYNLFIRCHPYLEKVFWKYNKDVINLHEPESNIYVVKPGSPVSSYEMLLNANKVLTYNSQTGIEAVYWEKPSIILGRRVYENLNCVYKPKNHNDVMRLIYDDNLKAKSKLGSIIYASYWVDGGFTYNSFSGSMKVGYKFKKNYLSCLKKIKVNKNKNFYLVSNLKKIGRLKIKKDKKINILLDGINEAAGKNCTIFSPSASMNLINTNQKRKTNLILISMPYPSLQMRTAPPKISLIHWMQRQKGYF